MFHGKSTILSFNRLLATMTISFLWSTIAVTRDSRRQSTSHLHTKIGDILEFQISVALKTYQTY